MDSRKYIWTLAFEYFCKPLSIERTRLYTDYWLDNMPLVALPDELREMEAQVLVDETPHPPNDREELVLGLARSSVPDDTQKQRYRKQRSRHTRPEETLFPGHEPGNDTATLLVVPNTPQPVRRRTTPNKIENYSHQSTDRRPIPVKAIKSSL